MRDTVEKDRRITAADGSILLLALLDAYGALLPGSALGYEIQASLLVAFVSNWL